MTKYIATQSVGHFKTGDEVKGLTDKRAKELLEGGAIKIDETADKGPVKTTKTATKTKSEDK
ncbi:hypothetical protein [Psychrobacter pygoscelis]|uniref:hypothetical protein n=1 Tax=Psychrobacter pygoscelis TaxID=2488563 RepID=UPI00103B0323|nr:hypothetical protein [Psychrobacter pygoscelis]